MLKYQSSSKELFDATPSLHYWRLFNSIIISVVQGNRAPCGHYLPTADQYKYIHNGATVVVVCSAHIMIYEDVYV